MFNHQNYHHQKSVQQQQWWCHTLKRFWLQSMWQAPLNYLPRKPQKKISTGDKYICSFEYTLPLSTFAHVTNAWQTNFWLMLCADNNTWNTRGAIKHLLCNNIFMIFHIVVVVNSHRIECVFFYQQSNQIFNIFLYAYVFFAIMLSIFIVSVGSFHGLLSHFSMQAE